MLIVPNDLLKSMFLRAPTQSPSQTPTQSPSQTPTDNPTTQFCDVNGADSTYMETINVDADAYGGKVRRIIASGNCVTSDSEHFYLRN